MDKCYRDGSVVKGACCSCRGLTFIFLSLMSGSSQSLVTPTPEDPITSDDLCDDDVMIILLTHTYTSTGTETHAYTCNYKIKHQKQHIKIAQYSLLGFTASNLSPFAMYANRILL